MIFGRIKEFSQIIGVSWVAIVGAALTTSAFIGDVILILGEMFIHLTNPYIGIFAYMVFPGLMIFGLLLIPLGVFLRMRSFGHGFTMKALRELIDEADVERPGYAMQTVVLLTLVNLVVFAFLGYRGFHFMDSTTFCGQVCHSVMEPEFTTYRRSPHSEINCVECHIGPGASWFVKSKLSGARQVLAVTFDTYSKPIETPIENLRPAREVCEVCHRPEIFHGNLIKVIERYDTDENNTKNYTVLNMRVGSGGEHGTEASGIHWHVAKSNTLRYYATDRERENIVWIELQEEDGTRRIWKKPDAEDVPENIPEEELRVMDCVDCHNRPTHIYLPPDTAINEAMTAGRLDPSIPYIRKMAEEVLVKKYETREEAMAAIDKLPDLYQEQYPDVWEQHQDKVKGAVSSVKDIYNQFVFPEMNVQWNTYTSLIGHETDESARCFRCHGSDLEDEEGSWITMDCESCHYVLSNQEEDPEILKILSGQI